MAFTSIWNNDEAIKFFEENNYPREYNDGLYAYLRDTYNIFNTYSIPSLPDLLRRYLNDYGDTFNMAIAGKSAVKISLVEPATTFTATTPTDGGSGTIVLTSAGTHGLTSAVSVGASIYISAGTGWTPGFYLITALDLDTTGVAITILGTFDIGMGSPTIALANTEVTLASVTIPPLLPDSMIRIDQTFSSTDTSGTTKVNRAKLNTTNVFSIALTTSPNIRRVTVIHNRGATDSQVLGLNLSASSGEGSTSTPVVTASIDTSVETTINFAVLPSSANVVQSLERYLVEVFK